MIVDSAEALGVKWAAGAGGTDSDAIHDNVAAEISAITSKATPDDADFLLIEDAAASDAKKKITIGDLPGGVSALDDLSDVDMATDGVVGDALSILSLTALNVQDTSGVTADSNRYDQGRDASNTVDDNRTTYLLQLSKSSADWTSWDFGTDVTLGKIGIYSHPSAYWSAWDFHSSDDGIAWDFIERFTGLTNDDTATFPTTTARYWRLSNGSGGGGTNFYIYEAYFWNVTGSPAYGPGTRLNVDQSDASAAVPVVTLEQADVDEDFFKFIGTSDTNVDRALVDAVNFPTAGTIKGWIKINVQDDQGTGPIVDGDYYIPFYAAPT